MLYSNLSIPQALHWMLSTDVLISWDFVRCSRQKWYFFSDVSADVGSDLGQRGVNGSAH